MQQHSEAPLPKYFFNALARSLLLLQGEKTAGAPA